MMTPEERAEAQALYRGAKDKETQLAIISQMYPAATQAELNDALGTKMTDWPKKRDVPAHKKMHKWTSGEVARLRPRTAARIRRSPRRSGSRNQP